MATGLISSNQVDLLASLGIRADCIVQATRLPHVEGTCPQGTSFLPGHRLLRGAHLELDVVEGLGEHLRRFIRLAE